MIDFLGAAQDAVFDALNVPSVTSLAPVYQHVPDDSEPPYIKISDLSSQPFGVKGGGLDEVTVPILFYYRKPNRLGLTAMAAAARTAIETAVLSAAGAVVNLKEISAVDAPDSEDGITYDGALVAVVWVQPA